MKSSLSAWVSRENESSKNNQQEKVYYQKHSMGKTLPFSETYILFLTHDWYHNDKQNLPQQELFLPNIKFNV